MRELAEEVASALGRPARIQHLDARNEVLHAFADHTAVRTVFAPDPPIDLANGLRRMAQLVLDQGPATPVRFENIEVFRNLPASWRS